MRIGIIGAENTHSAAIASTLNVKKSVRGASVTAIWGETNAFARATAEKGAIPNIVRTPRQMLGEIDALIVDHRHARHHLKAARPFLEAGIPVFVDKPFCYRSREGKDFLALARKTKTPVTSYSTAPIQKSFVAFRKKIAELGDLAGGAIFGHCDLRSPYGGVFFYGVHQVELAGEIFGYNVKSVQITQNRKCSTGQLLYASGVAVTLHFFKQIRPEFSLTVVGSKGIRHQEIATDPDPYLGGIKLFTAMFRTRREPRAHNDILQTVRILEALERSKKSGHIEKVLKN